MNARKLITMLAAGLSAFASVGNVVADDTVDYKGWNGSLGGGMMFYEQDEEIYSGQIYGVSAGYDFNNRWTLEGSFGYLPFLNANRNHHAPDYNQIDHDTYAVRFSSNLLYHLVKDPTSAFDPFVGLTGGMIYYGTELENNQQWNAFGGLATGVTYWLTKGLGLRGDYQFVAAGHDTEFNHLAMISLTYSWGRRAKAVAAAESDNLSAGTKNPNLKTIYFGFDSSELTATSKQTLKENADYLAKVAGTKVVLEGNCDERGTDEYNLALGERRARSAFEYLRSLGVSRDRMTTVSYGESKPAEAGHNEAAWSKNRRVECVEAGE